jgi:plasmid stabilization system protein ParE
MFDLVVSERAEIDLRKILTYIKEELEMPQSASSLSDRIDECYERLENNPFLYAECQDPRLKKEGFRRAVVKNYILLFKVFEQQNFVVVYRFFHSSQNYPNLI